MTTQYAVPALAMQPPHVYAIAERALRALKGETWITNEKCRRVEDDGGFPC